jgi:hypothetical protein
VDGESRPQIGGADRSTCGFPVSFARQYHTRCLKIEGLRRIDDAPLEIGLLARIKGPVERALRNAKLDVGGGGTARRSVQDANCVSRRAPLSSLAGVVETDDAARVRCCGFQAKSRVDIRRQQSFAAPQRQRIDKQMQFVDQPASNA